MYTEKRNAYEVAVGKKQFLSLVGVNLGTPRCLSCSGKLICAK